MPTLIGVDAVKLMVLFGLVLMLFGSVAFAALTGNGLGAAKTNKLIPSVGQTDATKASPAIERG